MILSFMTDHVRSIFMGSWTWSRLRRSFILFRMREGRGSGFIGQFWDYVRKGSDVAIFSIAFGVELVWIYYVLFGLGYLGFSYFIGYWDETKAKVWQQETEMNTTYINPYYQRIEQKLDNLAEDIKCLKLMKR